MQLGQRTPGIAPVNHVEISPGLASAVCQCCGKRSRPARTDSSGEPDLWDMAQGWSQAPFPASYVQPDGSVGSTYHCPSCNGWARKGRRLQVRAYLSAAAV